MKTFYLIAFLLALQPTNTSAQLIEKMGEALGNAGGESGGGSGAGSFWIDLIFNVGFYPTYGLLFGFENEPAPNEVMFSKYPYEDGRNGLYQPLDFDGYPLRAQVTAHFQNNEDNLYGAYFQAKFFPARFLALDVNHLRLIEKLETSGGGTDHFSITNLNLQYMRVRGSQFDLWWGGGLMLLDGGGILYGSPSFSGGFTWYFKKPLSLYADTQLAFPNGVFARQHQARMQVHFDRFMLYAGYQGLRIGEVNAPNLALGTGVWF